MGRSASIKNHARPLNTVMAAARFSAYVHPSLAATYPVNTGEIQPPRLPNVDMVPEMDPENFAEISLQVVHKTADAAKLKPAAMASCKSASVLFAV